MSTMRLSHIAILSLVIGCSGFLVPVHVRAAEPTLAELQAKLVGLQAQLAVLQGTSPTFTFTYVPAKAAFDLRSYTSVSTYPTLSGTANVENVFIVINTDKGVGLVGTEVPVEKGHWTYQSVVGLPVGYYTVQLFGGSVVQTRTLSVIAH